jgi:hypothetical protein
MVPGATIINNSRGWEIIWPSGLTHRMHLWPVESPAHLQTYLQAPVHIRKPR